MDETLSLSILSAIPRTYVRIKREGTLELARTPSLQNVLGPEGAQLQQLRDFISLDPERLSMFEMGLEQYFENFMPIEVTISMLPKKILCRGLVVGIHYLPVLAQDGEPSAIILEMSDITKVEAKERMREIVFERNALLLRILRQKEAFLNFLKDSEGDLKALSSDPDEVIGKRLLHTLKGNSASFGLSEIATRIHEIEDEAAHEIDVEGSEVYFKHAAHEITGLLDTFLIENFPVLGVSRQDSENETFQISANDLNELERQFQFFQSTNAPATGLSATLQSMRSKPAHVFVSTFESTIERLSENLGKKIDFKVEGGAIRIDPESAGQVLREMIHVIRNSCDHGIEAPEIRLEKGKSETGRIFLYLRELSGQRVEISLEDDGAGIDSERLTKAAVKKGLLTEAEANTLGENEKRMLLFRDGVSTAEKATSVSGRGVGMAALKQRVDEIQGVIEIESVKDRGTTFKITLPQYAQKKTKNAKSANAAGNEGRISWDGSLSIGIQAMDDQHKTIVAYLADLQEEDSRGKRGESVDKKKVGLLLDGLLSYTVEHFSEEESLLERYDYPDLAAHRILHEKLIEQLESLIEEFKSSGLQVLPRLTHFTLNWLRGHILGNDRKYGQFIGQQHVHWDSSLQIGIPEMDDQHEVLIDYVNQLKRLSREAQDGKLSSYAPVGEVLDKVLDYTIKHFTAEEQILEKAAYPDLEHHKLLHGRLLKQATAFKGRFHKDPLKTIPALSAFLTNWLIVHIQGEDKKYAEFLLHAHKKAG